MNPFDLRGPLFLLFYVVFAAVVLLAVRLLRDAGSPGRPELDLADPYLIAYLRGGASEAIRVAVLSLIDRNLLVVDQWFLKRKEAAAIEIAHRPLEKRILASCGGLGRVADSLATDPGLVGLADRSYQGELEDKGLLIGPSAQATRATIGVAAGVLLAGVTVVKIAVAFSRGHHNVLFLIILSIVSLVLLRKLLKGRITSLGSRMLASLRSIYEGLEERAHRLKPGGATNELALLAAVYGFAAVPLTVFPDLRMLSPPAPVRRYSNDSGSESSCSSSCSSCGSSCGGGCGGGCGGCGGD